MSYYLGSDFVTQFSTVTNDYNWSRNGTNEDPCSMPSEFAWVILDYLNTYYTIVIIFFGLIGNLISAAVFLGTQLRSRSSSYYLAALAISDAIFLVSLLLAYFNIESSHSILCKGINYLSYVSTFLSVWLIVSFTIERFIAVQYPLQRPHMCTVKRAKFIVLGLMLCAFGFYVYIFITAGLQERCGTEMCVPLEEYDNIMNILNIFDMALTLALPILLIVIMNSMIAIQLYRFSRTYTQPIHVYQQSIILRNHDHSDQDQSASSMIQPYSAANGHMNISDGEVVRIVSFYQAKRTSQSKDESSYRSHTRSSSSSKILSQKMQFNITKMLLVISTVFIGLNLPSYVIRIYTMYNPELDRNIQLAQQFFTLLFYTHFSINFLLYSIYGVAFRRALLSFACENFRCLHQKASAGYAIQKTQSELAQYLQNINFISEILGNSGRKLDRKKWPGTSSWTKS